MNTTDCERQQEPLFLIVAVRLPVSSQPAPRNDPSLRRWMATAMFEAAQQSNEAAEEECHRRDELLSQLAVKAQCRTFWWRAETFEANIEIFYRPGDQLEILGCRVIEVDYERPAAKRRLEVEQRFLQALNEFGPLRDEVVSRIVG